MKPFISGLHSTVCASDQPVQRENIHVPLVLVRPRRHSNVHQLPSVALEADIPPTSRHDREKISQN